MPRSYVVYGESMVYVKGRTGTILGTIPHELGLTTDAIRITPKLSHLDINVDDFGPEVPADVMTMMTEATIRMDLVHYDDALMRACIRESMGGAGNVDGVCGAAGRPMGGGRPLYSPTNLFITVGILPLNYDLPWRFPAAYLIAEPLEIPIGTEKSIVQLMWRALPYAIPSTGTSFDLGTGAIQGGVSNKGEVVSNGIVVWDHQLI